MAVFRIGSINIVVTTDHVEVGRPRITANDNWLPRSGYGPYCTIPISSGVDPALLGRCGVPSFLGARDEVKLVAEGYAAWAVALVARAREERIDLAQEIRGMSDEPAIRPYRVRLCLRLDERRGYLYLCWRGVVKQGGRWIRIRASMGDCKATLDPLIVNVHPAEEVLIRRIEAEAAEIRRRWFALVRQLYYTNVTEEFRLADLEAGRIQPPRGRSSRLVGRLGVAFNTRRSKS